MQSWAAVGVGLILIVVGGLFMRWHVREWRAEQSDPSLDSYDLDHYRARYRRRMQTSGLLLFLGLLIPVWDWLLDQRFVQAATIMGFVIFGLVAWVFLMAWADLLSTKNHSRIALSKVRQKQRELERQASKLRNKDSNGHSPKSNGYN